MYQIHYEIRQIRNNGIDWISEVKAKKNKFYYCRSNERRERTIRTFARVEGLRIHEASLSPVPTPSASREPLSDRRSTIDDHADARIFDPAFEDDVDRFLEKALIEDRLSIVGLYDKGTKNIMGLLDVMMYSESEEDEHTVYDGEKDNKKAEYDEESVEEDRHDVEEWEDLDQEVPQEKKEQPKKVNYINTILL